jgi:hypothetical protein
MRGKTNEQIKQGRAAVVKQLEAEGHVVIDTVFDTVPKGVNEAIYYLSKSIELLGQADGVVFMPGWNTARGCIIEHQVATSYNKFIKYL